MTYPVVGQLQRQLDVGVGTGLGLLDQALAVDVVHDKVKVDAVSERARHLVAVLDHLLTLPQHNNVLNIYVYM